MRSVLSNLAGACVLLLGALAQAQGGQKVVDVPTRPGVTQRLLVLDAPEPRAVAVLLAGGRGGLQITPDGALTWGAGNFLVRSRQLFVEQGLTVAVLDAPSDRQSVPFLDGFRQTPEHVADLKAVIAWLRAEVKAPVWLIGTSRGTQSAAHAATQLAGSDAPDGIVLSATILSDPRGRAVPAMALDAIRIPVLAVHHEQDGCRLCAFADTAVLMRKLVNAPRKQLLSFTGGENRGDPCEPWAYHGFNGLERDVVRQMTAWMLAR